MTNSTEPTETQTPANPVYRIPGELYHRGQWCRVITGAAETVIVAYCSGPDYAKHREVPRAELEGGADIDDLIRKQHDNLGFSYLVAQRSSHSQCLLVAGFLTPSDAQHFAEWIKGTVMTPGEYLAARSAIWQRCQDEVMASRALLDAEIRAALQPVRAALPSDVAVYIDTASSGEGFTATASELDLSDINGSRRLFEETYTTIAAAASALAGFAVRMNTQRAAESGVAA
jgi:hypothetical protein